MSVVKMLKLWLRTMPCPLTSSLQHVLFFNQTDDIYSMWTQTIFIIIFQMLEEKRWFCIRSRRPICSRQANAQLQPMHNLLVQFTMQNQIWCFLWTIFFIYFIFQYFFISIYIFQYFSMDNIFHKRQQLNNS